VFDIVRGDYVDKPDDAKLVISSIKGMLSGLDPHSSYMDAQGFRDMEEETRGKFGGVGSSLPTLDPLSNFFCATSEKRCLLIIVSPLDGLRFHDFLNIFSRRQWDSRSTGQIAATTSGDRVVCAEDP
jgi:C-terminal processing protease CtpA/Prc